MIIRYPRNTKTAANQTKIRSFIILATVCLLVTIPLSSASQSADSSNIAPDFKAVRLWDYNIDIRANYDNFWTAINPSKYVIPNNSIIQYYANNTDEIQIEYKPDYIDYWQNPDYTLKIMQGDCEDQSLVWVSIHRAKGDRAIVVGGYLYLDDGTVIRDIWYEYVNGSTHKTKFVAPVTKVRKFSAIPLFMFNDWMSISDYDPGWMNK
jgi:hypothetical protein